MGSRSWLRTPKAKLTGWGKQKERGADDPNHGTEISQQNMSLTA